MEKDLNNEDEYITINLDGSDVVEETPKVGKRTAARMEKNAKGKKKGKQSGKGKKDKNGKEKKKWSKKKIALVILSIIAIIVAVVGIVFARYVYKAEGDVKQAVKKMATDVATNIVGKDEPIFVLVLGISEDITSKLTDTIILGGYNPETQKAFMLSIPRDTFVGTNEATASGWDKINALYQKDITRTIKAVEERTGINIDNYVVVRNTMLPAIVNAMGEVEFDVPIDMDYDDPTQNLHIHLQAGVQMINGDKAEQLLRFRHNNDGSSYPSSWGDNDYGRMRTQREFIKAVANKLIALDNVTNIKGIAEAIFANLETNMSIGDLIGYIPYAVDFNVDDIRMEQLPGSGAMLNKLSFFKASHTRSKALMEDLIEYLGLDDKEKKEYYTGKIKQTVAATPQEEAQDACEHKYASEIIKASTCKETGVRKYTCTLCGSTYEEEIATANHNYDSNGKCTLCGAEKKPEEHTCKYTVEIDVELEPSCYKDGSGTFACEVCGEKKNISIKATGKHVYGSDGKCTTDGCTATNGSSTQKPEDKPTCKHATTTTTETPATCGKPGSKVVKCSDCGTTISTTPTSATGNHTPGAPVITNPTCGAAGSEKVSCTTCGTVISNNPIGATGNHTYSNGTCTTCGATDPLYVAPPPPASDPVVDPQPEV